jgi:hypothetical protein
LQSLYQNVKPISSYEITTQTQVDSINGFRLKRKTWHKLLFLKLLFLHWIKNLVVCEVISIAIMHSPFHQRNDLSQGLGIRRRYKEYLNTRTAFCRGSMLYDFETKIENSDSKYCHLLTNHTLFFTYSHIAIVQKKLNTK